MPDTIYENADTRLFPDARIVVTGAAGFLGWNLARAFSAEGADILACRHDTPPDASLPVRWTHLPLERPDCAAGLEREPMDCLVHCAAIAGVGRCAGDPDLARRVNVAATRELAGLCARSNALFLFLSTDMVFGGDRGSYTEEDAVEPRSFYAETKVLAEQETASAGGRYYILRTSLMYGAHCGRYGSYLAWTIGTLAKGGVVDLYTNSFRTPLFAGDVASFIAGLLRSPQPPGIYHLGGPQRLNRFDMGRIAAVRILGHARGVRPCLFRRDGGPAVMDDLSLDTRKARDAVGVRFTSYARGLDRMLLEP